MKHCTFLKYSDLFRQDGIFLPNLLDTYKIWACRLKHWCSTLWSKNPSFIFYSSQPNYQAIIINLQTHFILSTSPQNSHNKKQNPCNAFLLTNGSDKSSVHSPKKFMSGNKSATALQSHWCSSLVGPPHKQE